MFTEKSGNNFLLCFLCCIPNQVHVCILIFQESVLNYRLDPLGIVDGFTAEVGASGVFCPTHMTLPVEVSFYSVSDDNAPSPYMVCMNFGFFYFYKNLMEMSAHSRNLNSSFLESVLYKTAQSLA